MDEYSKNLILYRLEKAKDELELSEHCIEVQKYSKSLNCSYYAIFHSVRALLAIEKIDFKKHSGVISYFIKNYIIPEVLDNELGLIIRTAERERNKGDYQDFFLVSKEEAIRQLNNAKLFNKEVLIFLRKQHGIDFTVYN